MVGYLQSQLLLLYKKYIIMKRLTIKLNLSIVMLLSTLFFISCGNNDDDLVTDPQNDNNKAVFNELLGTWIIQKSTINDKPVSSESFECLKTSVATFDENGYKVNYRKKGEGRFSAGCAVTQEFSGTYSISKEGIVDLNKSKGITAELKEGKLIITSDEDGTVQKDTFINEKDITNTVLDDVKDDTSTTPTPPAETEEFKKLKQKLQGVWKLTSSTINDEKISLTSCGLESNLTFKENNNKILILQKKATFTKGDLAKYGVAIGGTGINSIKVTKSTSVGGNTDKVSIDSDASCKFVKESVRDFELKKDNTLIVKGTKVEFTLKDDATIVLTFENSSTNTIGEKVFKKM